MNCASRSGLFFCDFYREKYKANIMEDVINVLTYLLVFAFNNIAFGDIGVVL